MWCTILGSLLIPLLLGVGLGDLLNGLPIDSQHEFTGNFFDLLTPFGLWTGLTLLGLCLLHGATFLKLRTTDQLRDRASALAKPLAWAAVALVVGFVIWTRSIISGPDVPDPVEILAVIAVIFAATTGEHRSRRLGLHRLGGSDRRHGRLDLHQPLPERHDLEHQCGLQPDRQQLGLRLLRAEGDDDRHRDLPAARAALPGLVLPRLPRSPQSTRCRARELAARRTGCPDDALATSPLLRRSACAGYQPPTGGGRTCGGAPGAGPSPAGGSPGPSRRRRPAANAATTARRRRPR